MKVFLKILFFLIIIIGVASPFATGYILETRYSEMIEKLNKAYEGEIIFTGKFQRGFMKSIATTDIASSKGMRLESLQHIVLHGPVIFGFNGWLNASTYMPQGFALAKVNTQLSGNYAKKLTAMYAGKTAYNIDTTVAFNGDTATTFINYPLTTQVGVGIFKWQGANGTVNIDKDVTKIVGTMAMASLEYSEQVQSNADTETLQISNFKMDFSRLISDSSNMMNVTLGAFKILNKGVEDLALNNIALMFNKKDVNKIESGEIRTGFTTLKVADHNVGPFSLNIKINNINAAALAAAMQDPAFLASAINKIQPNIPSDQVVAMLNTKPSLDSDMNVTMPDGNIDYVGHFEVGGSNIVSDDASVIIPTVKLSQKLKISSKIVMKLLTRYIEEAVRRNEKMYFINNKTSTITNPWTMPADQLKIMAIKFATDIINILKTKQYIIEQNDIMSTDIEFANSVLTVNGVQHTKEDLDQLKALMQVTPPVITAPPASTIEPVPNVPATPQVPVVVPGPVLGKTQ